MDLVLYLVPLTYTPASQRDPEIDLDLDLGTVIRGRPAAGRRWMSGGGCGCGVSLGAGDDLAGAHDGKADEVQVHGLSGGPILAVRPHTHAAHFRDAVTGPFWVVTLGARLVAVGRGKEISK